MSTKLLSTTRVVAFVMLFLVVAPVAESNERSSSGDTLKPTKNDVLLDLLSKAEKASAKGKSLGEFRSHAKAERLGALAYALKERKHSRSALQVIIDDQEMQDRRLAPFLVKTIEGGKEKELLLSARVAKKLSDPVLLAPLIEKALGSEYFEVDTCAAPNGRVEFVYNSVFAETAEAIYRISNGKLGKERVSRNHMPVNKNNTQLIQKWRKTWKEDQSKEEKN